MLRIRKNVTLNGESIFGEKQAAGFSAVINSENPEDMTINQWQANKSLYKEKRVDVNADFAEFQNAAYALQDEMIAALQ